MTSNSDILGGMDWSFVAFPIKINFLHEKIGIKEEKYLKLLLADDP